MSKNNETEENTSSDLIKMILASQESNKNKNTNGGIVINPMVAVTTLVAIVIIMVQVFIGFGLWAMQDKLGRYDGYEARIVSLEKAIVKFEGVPGQLDTLASKFEAFANEPKNIIDSLSRIEKSVADKFYGVTEDVDENKSSIKSMDGRIYELEKTVDSLERDAERKK